MSTKVIPFAEGLKRIGISRAHAERLMRDPRSDFLRPFWIGRKRFYRRSDVTAYLERKHAEAQSRDEYALAAFAVPPSMIMQAFNKSISEPLSAVGCPS